MDKATKRNIIGSIICFLLSVFLGGIAIHIMMVREVKQSEQGGFPIEVDDILRYSFIGTCGYLCNVTLIIIGVNLMWFS